jgi:hypothetical protein
MPDQDVELTVVVSGQPERLTVNKHQTLASASRRLLRGWRLMTAGL